MKRDSDAWPVELDSSPNPFPGLRPFRTDEHHLFFGREEQTAALLGLLREHRFLSVVGTSGSGKSSLVRAGLIPACHRGTMAGVGSSWEVVVVRPGGNPVSQLARALIDADLYDAEDPDALPRVRATLTRSLLGLVEAVRQSSACENACQRNSSTLSFSAVPGYFLARVEAADVSENIPCGSSIGGGAGGVTAARPTALSEKQFVCIAHVQNMFH